MSRRMLHTNEEADEYRALATHRVRLQSSSVCKHVSTVAHMEVDVSQSDPWFIGVEVTHFEGTITAPDKTFFTQGFLKGLQTQPIVLLTQ